MTRGLIGWNVAIWLYLVAAGVMILRSEHQDIHRRAALQDEGRYAILPLAALSSTVSFGAIFAQLASVKDTPHPVKGSAYRLGAGDDRRVMAVRPHDLRAALRA